MFCLHNLCEDFPIKRELSETHANSYPRGTCESREEKGKRKSIKLKSYQACLNVKNFSDFRKLILHFWWTEFSFER